MRKPPIGDEELDAKILAIVDDFDIFPMIWGELNMQGALAADLNEKLEKRLRHLVATNRLAAVFQEGRTVYRRLSLLETIARESSDDRTRRGSSASSPGT